MIWKVSLCMAFLGLFLGRACPWGPEAQPPCLTPDCGHDVSPDSGNGKAPFPAQTQPKAPQCGARLSGKGATGPVPAGRSSQACGSAPPRQCLLVLIATVTAVVFPAQASAELSATTSAELYSHPSKLGRSCPLPPVCPARSPPLPGKKATARGRGRWRVREVFTFSVSPVFSYQPHTLGRSNGPGYPQLQTQGSWEESNPCGPRDAK